MRAPAPRPPYTFRARTALLAFLTWATVALLALSAAAPARADDGSPPPLGSTQTFQVEDWGNERSIDIAANVRRVGEHSVLYVQKGRSAPDPFLDALTTAFDTGIYPILTTVMGPEPNPGIDGEQRIVLLLYDFNSPSIQGAFFPHDIDPAAPPGSNQREMIMLNLESVISDVELASAAAAHEFAHLIVYYRNFLLDPNPGKKYRGNLEYRWIEEGLAMYAELATGHGTRARDYLRSFAFEPTKNLTRWEGRPWNNDYGASYSFMAYVAELTGQSIIRRLVDTPMAGIAGIDAALEANGSFPTFASLFDGWVITNFLDGRPPASPYSIGAIDIAAEPVAVPGAFPLVGASDTENYAARYLDLPETPDGNSVRVVLDGDDGPYLHAALISWDSAGEAVPSVDLLPLSGHRRWSCDLPSRLRPAHPGGLGPRPRVGRRTVRLPLQRRGQPRGRDPVPGCGQRPPLLPLHRQPATPGRDQRQGAPGRLWSVVLPGRRLGPESPVRQDGHPGYRGAHGGYRQPLGPHLPRRPPSFDGQGEPLPYPFDYVEEASAAGIVNGYTDGRFGPWDEITRIQLVRMILRAGSATGRAFPAYTGSQDVFADVPPGSPLYADAMTAYENGILTGSEPDAQGRRYFWPWRSATRGHVAKMTSNLVDWLAAAGS
ncbi:MAG: S-layer homology domain-containing protein [Thermoleophilia bacterium]|nr:S-layer homology domain-containing protein [Thermoleophilia bacterium]